MRYLVTTTLGGARSMPGAYFEPDAESIDAAIEHLRKRYPAGVSGYVMRAYIWTDDDRHREMRISGTYIEEESVVFGRNYGSGWIFWRRLESEVKS